MSVQLLDKTRKINSLLHNNATTTFVFSDICAVLCETLASNVLVLSKKGKILGFGEYIPAENKKDRWNNVEIGKIIDEPLNERLLNILSTRENINLTTLGFEGSGLDKYHIIVTPINIAGERLGTVFAYNKGNPYDIEDIIVAEYGTAIVGLELVRSLSEEKTNELRKRHAINAAMNTLSTSEVEAVGYIIKEMDGDEGILVASKLADSAGITRSVIVNAIRKLESAGVIESRSSGMKGTFIKICNELLFEEIEKASH